MYAGIGAVMAGWCAIYWRAWKAPARELAGRTPVAGPRSKLDVQRMSLGAISYGQLGLAAVSGVALPFLTTGGGDMFSGWNRLWLLFGAVLVAGAAVQAFRKWRVEQEDALRGVTPGFSEARSIGSTYTAEREPSHRRFWRYLPLAALLLLFAFIGLTRAGKQLAQSPSFWLILLFAGGVWALFTVVQGLARGQIQPFARGFYNTYRREQEPKRFWASVTWNALFGCFSLWIAVQMLNEAGGVHEPGNGVGHAQRGPSYDVRAIFGPEDYPVEAILRNDQGSVQTRVKIGPDGRVRDCSVVQSSGSAALDRATCEILTQRARFTPARDSEGRPTGFDYTPPAIVWRLED